MAETWDLRMISCPQQTIRSPIEFMYLQTKKPPEGGLVIPNR
jgi:hypothetical protein